MPNTTTTTTTTTNDQIDVINKIRVSKPFNGSMAVDVDKAAKTVSVTFAPAYGNTVPTVKLTDPSLMDFLDTLVKVTDLAHEAAKADLVKNGEGLILKAISLSAVRDQLKEKLAASNRDVKAALELKQVELDKQAAKAARVEALTAELAELKG